MGPILDVLTGWSLYAGLIAVLGACAARWFLIPPAVRGLEGSAPAAAGPTAGAAASVLGDAAGRLAFAGALLLPPAMVLFFVRQLLEFRDPFVPWTEDAQLLVTGTAWGTTWLQGAAGSALAVVAFGLVARGARAAWWVGGLVGLLLAAFPAFTGHASGSDGPRALTLTADVLHVWAAGGWVGGLAFVLYAEGRWRRAGVGTGDPLGHPAADEADGGRMRSLLPTLVPVFSTLAVVCVGLLGVSGLAGAWVHLTSLADLTASPYGRTLLLKLALVAVVLALGFVNWRRLTPRLREDDGPDALRRAATTELLVAQAVLVVTSLLVRTPPPMG